MIETRSVCPKRRKSLDDNLIPLINVVFLMLIFFLVAGQITASEPEGFFATQTRETLLEQKARELELHALSDGSIVFEGQKVTELELVPLIRKRLLYLDTDATVSLKPDARMQASQLQVLLLSLKRAGVKSVELQLQRGANVS